MHDLRARGDHVESLDGANDARGEDGCLLINGQRVQVQIVTLPVDDSLWRELSSRGTAIRQGMHQDAVTLVRQALEHKRGKATGTVLVLDAAHVGAIISSSLVDSYYSRYGDPEQEFSLVEAWIVGPSARSAIRLRR
jgi:hypothetical protein